MAKHVSATRGYPQANRRNNGPLTPDERRWFRVIVQKVAALLALSARRHELYSAAADNAFTATELVIDR